MTGPFDLAAAAVRPPDEVAKAEAAALHDRLTKPRGALGRLEALGMQLAAIAGSCPPPLPTPAAVAVFAADHGVVAEGVTPWPQEVTAQMVANIRAGGAAISVLARQAGAAVTVIDVGVAGPLPAGWEEEIVNHRIRVGGSGNITTEVAMSPREGRRALDVGASVASDQVRFGARALVTGEMGIGNTTPSAALIAAITGNLPAVVTGRGTGVDDDRLAQKVAVVERALARHRDAVADGPLATLAALGGLEIAALVGYIVGGASAGVPVVVDGVIAVAALAVAEALVPGVRHRCLAGHRSAEPGASVALEALGMEPMLQLDMRLGEGSGACLALPLLEAAARVMREMATFDTAGVTQKQG